MKLADELDTRYYTADMHHASFVLPAFVRKVCKHEQLMREIIDCSRNLKRRKNDITIIFNNFLQINNIYRFNHY
jgi:hypothetical protein